MSRTVFAVVKGMVAVGVLGGASYALLGGVDAQQTAQRSVGGYTAPVDVDTAGLRGPVQPIFYRHDIHAGQYEMDCRYCHYAVEVSSSPGLPSLETCMGCHQLVGMGNPEVDKLRQAVAANETIEWTEIHELPSFVRFPHMRHVNAEVACETCHGQIDRMPQVYQVSSLKMGWCLSCHIENDVTTDCTACHY